MSVMIDTSLGEVVVDLFCDEAPLAAKNFLKLCKLKYYNGCLFYNVQQNFMIQTGDPTASGKGGTSVYGLMYGEQARFFEDEIKPTSHKHNEAGLLSMANMGVPDSNGSQFFFSMRGDDMQHLDGKHTVFAKVMEGMETLEEINGQFCDNHGRPYRDIRILHTYVLDDPFDDPPQLSAPDESPLRDRPEEERVPLRLGALDKVSLEADEKTEIEREKQLREKTARSNAVVLEMIGDLPDADMKPPENVLFVCKLNPVTTDDDLEIIFTRFGTCRAEICRDHVTGDSLNYAFVEYEAIESCEEAFKKMNNVLIDDRRIRVDFSQSVAKEWSKYKGRAQGGQKLASGKGGKAMQPHQQNQNQNRQQQQDQQHHLQQGQIKTGEGSASASQKRRSKWGNAPIPIPTPAPTTALPTAAAPPGSTVFPSSDGVHRGGESHSGRGGGERSEGASRWSAGSLDKANGGDGGGNGGSEGRAGNGRRVRERPRKGDRLKEGRRRADGEWRGAREVDGPGRGEKDSLDSDGLDKDRRDNYGGSESRRAPERRESTDGRRRGGDWGGGRGEGRGDDNAVDNGSDDDRVRGRRSGGGGGGGGSRGVGAERDSRGSGCSTKGSGGGDDRDDGGRAYRVSVRSSTGDGRRIADRGRGDERNDRDERNERGESDGRNDRCERNGRGGRGERDGRDRRDERNERDGRDREGDRGGNRDGRSARKRSRSRSSGRERARGRSGSRQRHGRR